MVSTAASRWVELLLSPAVRNNKKEGETERERERERSNGRSASGRIQHPARKHRGALRRHLISWQFCAHKGFT